MRVALEMTSGRTMLSIQLTSNTPHSSRPMPDHTLPVTSIQIDEASPHQRRAERNQRDQHRHRAHQHRRLDAEDPVADAGDRALRDRAENQRVHDRLRRCADRIEIVVHARAEDAFENRARFAHQPRPVAQQEEHREHGEEQLRYVAADAADEASTLRPTTAPSVSSELLR